MVGFDPSCEVQLSHSHHAIAGAVSGAVSRALLQPLDVVKIRLQLQIEPIGRWTGSKYYGFGHAVYKIIKEEGPKALWKGHVPAQYLSITYALLQFAAFEFSTKVVWHLFPEDYSQSHRPMIHMACGSFAGSFAAINIHPLDVLRTRFVAQGEPKLYHQLHSACRMIWKQEGPLAFYRGLIPSLVLITPQTGLQFALYTSFTEVWKRFVTKTRLNRAEPLQSFLCGSGSGVCAKLIVYPFDVVKKRLQVQGFEEARRSFGRVCQYRGLWHCLRTLAAEEGLRGFYKGLFPTLLKSGSVTGVSFFVYERVCASFEFFYSETGKIGGHRSSDDDGDKTFSVTGNLELYLHSASATRSKTAFPILANPDFQQHIKTDGWSEFKVFLNTIGEH